MSSYGDWDDGWDDDVSMDPQPRTKLHVNEYYVSLIKTPREKVVCLDTETTGLGPRKGKNEILQVALVDGNGKTLFSSYIKPEFRKRWPKAAEVNHITWEMVKDKPTMDDVHEEIQGIVDSAQVVMGYNVGFDLSFLKAAGIRVGNGNQKVYDVMEDYSRAFGKWGYTLGKYKWEKLTQAEAHYGIRSKAHDAESDARATVEVFYRMMEDPRFTSLPDHMPETPTKANVTTAPATPATRANAGDGSDQFGMGCLVGLIIVVVLTMLFTGCVSMVMH